MLAKIASLIVVCMLLTVYLNVCVGSVSAGETAEPIPGRGYNGGEGELIIDDGNATLLYLDGANNTYTTQYRYNGWTHPIYIDTVEDSHGLGYILQTSDGDIHYFYGCHDDGMLLKQTVYQNDNRNWSATDYIPDDKDTYPSAYEMQNGSIFLAYRYILSSHGLRTQWRYTLSMDNGENWNPSVLLVNSFDIAGFYGSFQYLTFKHSVSDGIDYIHFAFDDGQSTDSMYRHKVLYAKLNVATSHIFNASGSDLGTVIDSSNVDSCYAYSGDESCFYPNVNLDSNEYPYVLFTRETDASSHNYSMIRWTGSSWNLSDIAPYFQKTGIAKGFTKSNGSIIAYFTNDLDYPSRNAGLFRSYYSGVQWSVPELMLANYTLESETPLWGISIDEDSEAFAVSQNGTYSRIYIYSASFGWLTNGTTINPSVQTVLEVSSIAPLAAAMLAFMLVCGIVVYMIILIRAKTEKQSKIGKI